MNEETLSTRIETELSAAKHLIAGKLRRWQGARSAAEAADDLRVSQRTYENWVQERYLPQGMAMVRVTLALALWEKQKKEAE